MTISDTKTYISTTQLRKGNKIKNIIKKNNKIFNFKPVFVITTCER